MPTSPTTLLIGQTSNHQQPVVFYPAMANRHGLIAGATGTGKTLSLKQLVEHFSDIGTPVFLVDVKGDLSGLAKLGGNNPKVAKRATDMAIEGFAYSQYPVVLWDVFGQQGHPIRATISEMGPLLLGRLLDLNPTQQAVLNVAFQLADDNGWLLLDLKDLQALVKHLSDDGKQYADQYGSMAPATLGAIQRSLVALDGQGGDQFFGEPALNLADLMRTASDGKGNINLLAADKLMASPQLYATFLLWLLSELYETLPEAGDLDKPKLVLFFDEAHLMFSDIPDVLAQKIKQIMLLIRSKGVGVYYITQNPMDIPDDVRGQLGLKILHAIRAFSPKEQKLIRALADSFPSNPALDLASLIPTLAIGEAIVSVLDTNGLPTPAQQTMMAPPKSFVGPLTAPERQAILAQSPVQGVYEIPLDRESAHERLSKVVQATPVANQAPPASQPATHGAGGTMLGDVMGGLLGGATGAGRRRSSANPMEAMVSSAARAIGSQVGRSIVRGLLGSLMGGNGGSRRR
jgi:uncharacterized protein